jgi:hypothetical protein
MTISNDPKCDGVCKKLKEVQTYVACTNSVSVPNAGLWNTVKATPNFILKMRLRIRSIHPQLGLAYGAHSIQYLAHNPCWQILQESNTTLKLPTTNVVRNLTKSTFVTLDGRHSQNKPKANNLYRPSLSAAKKRYVRVQ